MRKFSSLTRLFVVALLVVLSGCDGSKNERQSRQAAEPGPLPRPAFERGLAAPVPEKHVEQRVRDAKKRLQSSAGGKVIWQAIEAHGGLSDWYRQGTMEFSFNYQPVEQPERTMHTRQKVDLWRSHARHKELGQDADAEFAFDGEKAWITPGPEAFPSSARFWALTPYYFVAMPFVLADPGVNLEKLEDAVLDGETFDIVKATFEQGTGDAPDDYYVLYVGKGDHRVRALRYVVSYPGFFPKGKHSPEKLMHFDRYREKAPILARQLDTYAWTSTTQKPGELRTKIAVTYHKFGETFAKDWLVPPQGAVISELVFVKEDKKLERKKE